ncbi:unnamed protein product [Rangifer tarandus platyrhynchus]|uniref:Uncharacterized protein n=1 Tax=Rangifer tarandus platyrhynchus TaxID=3082113 RepID=A0AC59ZNL2_RANTA
MEHVALHICGSTSMGSTAMEHAALHICGSTSTGSTAVEHVALHICGSTSKGSTAMEHVVACVKAKLHDLSLQSFPQAPDLLRCAMVFTAPADLSSSVLGLPHTRKALPSPQPAQTGPAFGHHLRVHSE